MMICQREPHFLIPRNNHMNYHSLNLFPRISYTGDDHEPVVRAATELTVHSSTEVIDVHRIYQADKKNISHIEITVTNGHLHSLNGIDASLWIQILTIAKDCQSSNVELMSTDKGVYLKTIKIIAAGEPLVMWFTGKILATMNILPYLLPIHIQGQSRYTCDKCKRTFKCPNPLKIHLALHCNHYDTSYLWILLAKNFHLYQESYLPMNFFPPLPPFKLELSSSQQTSKQFPLPMPYPMEPFDLIKPPSEMYNSVNIHSPTSSQGSSHSGNEILSLSPKPQPVKPLTDHLSAFKPYTSQPIHQSFNVTKSKSQMMNTFEKVQAPPLAPVAQISADEAAQIETIYSNMGKSDKCHRCKFCGKNYSRKYGLKIHIRTHTGYKPLQCHVCKRAFGDPSNLNKHVRLHVDHDGETPYRCNICGKVLVRRRDLDRHIKSRHHGGNATRSSSNISDGSSDLDV